MQKNTENSEGNSQRKPRTVTRPAFKGDLTPELAEFITSRLADGIPLAEILRNEEEYGSQLPSRMLVYKWIRENEEFAALMNDARDAGADVIAESTLEIADDSRNDFILKKTQMGDFVELQMESVHRSKLRVEARLKLLAKWHPKKYGDKIDVTHDHGEVKITVDDKTAKL